MVYWTIVPRGHGVYDIVQYGCLRDGSVYGLSIVALHGMCDSYARDVAEQALHFLVTRTDLLLRERFLQANRCIQSRYELWTHAVKCRLRSRDSES